MKNKIRKFSEVSESLNQSSKDDLINLKNELEFINKFDIKPHEIIIIINQLLKMNWNEIENFKEEAKSHNDEFTVRLIDRYCSNIED